MRDRNEKVIFVGTPVWDWYLSFQELLKRGFCSLEGTLVHFFVDWLGLRSPSGLRARWGPLDGPLKLGDKPAPSSLPKDQKGSSVELGSNEPMVGGSGPNAFEACGRVFGTEVAVLIALVGADERGREALSRLAQFGQVRGEVVSEFTPCNLVLEGPGNLVIKGKKPRISDPPETFELPPGPLYVGPVYNRLWAELFLHELVKRPFGAVNLTKSLASKEDSVWSFIVNQILPKLPEGHLIFLNEAELEWISGIKPIRDALLWLREKTAARLCVTLGVRGGLYVEDNSVWRWEVTPGEVVQRTTLGDRLAGVWFGAEAQGEEPLKAMHLGVAAADIVALRGIQALTFSAAKDHKPKVHFAGSLSKLKL